MRAFFLFGVILLGFIISCKEEMIGLCDSPFETNVSQPAMDGDYRAYVVTVKKGHKWWLTDISVNGNTSHAKWGDEVLKDQFVLEHEKYIFEKIDNSSIRIKLKVTESNEPLKLVVTLQYGNCFGGFTLENR